MRTEGASGSFAQRLQPLAPLGRPARSISGRNHLAEFQDSPLRITVLQIAYVLTSALILRRSAEACHHPKSMTRPSPFKSS